MGRKQKYYIATPAYNESGSLSNYFKAMLRAVHYAQNYELAKTYICANGCTDNTVELIKKYTKRHPELKIELLHSKKGMNRALCKIIETIQNKSLPTVKIDADVKVDRKAISILLDELNNNKELQIVGGHPLAEDYKGLNPIRHLMTNILDVRSRHPMSQIAVNDVSMFHKLALTDPQPTVSTEFEMKSRIYFHGRLYALRNKEVWNAPANRIGDDTYLTLDTYKRYGYGSIRLRYDAKCYYHPSRSLIGHWKVYKRIFCDTYTLFELPEFQSKRLKNTIDKEKVRLDWSYIMSLQLQDQLYFVLYSIVKHIFNYMFKLSPKYSDELWTYKTKTR